MHKLKKKKKKNQLSRILKKNEILIREFITFE